MYSKYVSPTLVFVVFVSLTLYVLLLAAMMGVCKLFKLHIDCVHVNMRISDIID